MCYSDRLVILRDSYMFGNLTTRGEGDHLGVVEEHKIWCQKHLSGKESFQLRDTDKALSHEKQISFRIASKYLLRVAFNYAQSGFSSFWCKIKLVLSFLQWLQHIAVSVNPSAAQLSGLWHFKHRAEIPFIWQTLAQQIRGHINKRHQ